MLYRMCFEELIPMLSSEHLLPLVPWIINAWHEDTLGLCVVGLSNIVDTLRLSHIKSTVN